MHGTPVLSKLDSGWLLGFDAGEFGGGLWKMGENGGVEKNLSPRVTPGVLQSDNVHALVRRNGEILVFTGLAHVFMNEGKVYSYKPGKNQDSLTLVADLGAAPSDAVLDANGDVMIATMAGVLKLASDNTVETVYHNNDMTYVYPTSIAVIGDVVTVAMRHYVLQLAREGERYSPVWYRCKHVQHTSTGCTCSE